MREVRAEKRKANQKIIEPRTAKDERQALFRLEYDESNITLSELHPHLINSSKDALRSDGTEARIKILDVH